MPINKFTTLLDLARQAKIISGETATFDGKIQVGIPFSGYPTGVDTGTTVSLGIVSSEDAVFSGNTGTTIFDVSNTGSTNYSPIFSGYTASTWTNPLFSGNTSGLTLPITPLSADTQIVGPFWTLTQTGMTGDYVIGTQYTGYSVTYSFFNVSQFGTGFTYSGFTTASQENFSAGTLDYKGPLDYISTKEDASVEGRLTTNKLTVTNGASASTIGYVLTQTGENGEAEWVINASAGTNTYVTGGTLTLPSAGSNLILGWNTGGSANPIDLSSLEFTGNTSGDCITDLYVRRLYGCSPITVHDTITYNGSIIDSATTNSFIFGSNHVLTASSLTHGVNADANVILGGNDNRITPNSTGFYNTIIGGYGNEMNARINYASIIGATNSNISSSTLAPTTIIGGDSNTIETSQSSVIIGGEGNFIGNSDRTIILGGSGITGTTDDTVYTPDLNVSGDILINNTYGSIFSELDVLSPNDTTLTLSGTSPQLTEFRVLSPNAGGISIGIRGETAGFSDYGKVKDGYIYSSELNNGINIISQVTNPQTTDDYIRFYAGQGAGVGTIADLHIQGSGSTRGNIGINNESPTSKLDIVGTNGYRQLRLRTSYTPTSTADSNGEIGDIAWDNSYLYIKTGTGWGRVRLDFAF
jgi:hypothetical protein